MSIHKLLYLEIKLIPTYSLSQKIIYLDSENALIYAPPEIGRAAKVSSELTTRKYQKKYKKA